MHTVYYYVILPILLPFCLSTNVSLRTIRQSPRDCGPDKYKCINGECIETYSVCDGVKHCSDGSDETLATCSKLSIQCPAYAFRCVYGACVDRTAKCDGNMDCADNSDELLPECKKTSSAVQMATSSKCKDGEFKCDSGECIDEYAVCDGTADCSDASDESIQQCINIRCPAFTFQCAYGACIEKSKICNKVNDCNDGSDEDPELCNTVKPVPVPVPTKGPPVTPTKPTRLPGKGQCTLPEFPVGGSYIIHNCITGRTNKCQPVPGTPVDSSTVLLFSCKDGYVLPEIGKNIFCLNGAWDTEAPKCLKLCTALISSSLDIRCIYRGDDVSCENPMRPGTKVYPQCKHSYHEADPSATFYEATCLPDGEWNNRMFRCIPDCGKPSHNVQETLISYGMNASTGDYPWHVGIYTKGANDNTFAQSCGGTLISPHVVLTASHCIYVETRRSVLKPSDVKVAAGKLIRAWEFEDAKVQRRDVREILKPQKYEGSSTSFAQDIALLDLVSSFILNDVVLPACLDKKATGQFYTPPRGTLGTVVGWGVTEKNVSSEVLLYAKLPYLEYLECLSKSSASFRRFITYDKFCAGYENGTSVQKGDSGGGLTFIRNDLHYVYGVVSLKPQNENIFAVFTNVSDHYIWIESALKAFRFEHIKQGHT